MVSVFPASEKFDSDLELDAGMHKTERATRDMMGNVGAPFSFHHKRILNLAVVSRFIGNAKLTAAKRNRGFLGAHGHTQEGGGGEQEEDTLKDGLTLLGEGDSVLLPSKALNESSFNDPFQYALL